jgi:MscS family membrane protein
MGTESLYVQVLWGVALWRLLAATVIILFGFAARRIIVALFRGFLKRQADKTSVEWDDELVEHMPAPLAAIAQVGVWYGAVLVAQLPKEPFDIRGWAQSGLVLALWVAAAWVVFRLVDVLCGALARMSEKTESRLDDQLIPLLRKTLKVVIAIIVFVMAVQNLGYSVTSLVASLGVGGLALALAAKDTVANLFGSFVVFTDQPFQIGDWVEFGSVQGTVEEVGFRTTRVRRFDKSLVTVPNATFSDTPIINHSRRPIRQVSFTVGLTYESKAAQLKTVLEKLRELVSSHEEIDDEFHFVHFTNFGASSLDLQIYCFTKSTNWVEFLAAREDLMLKIMEIVEGEGLEMAFPTQTLYLRDEQWPQRAA